MKSSKISLSGYAGSGKSTVGKIIAKKLNYEFISIGNYSRNIAEKEYGLSINEFQEKCKNNPEIDHEIDLKFQKYCNNHEKIIVDYRLGFHFIDNSFNVLLKVSNTIAEKRINNASRENEETNLISLINRNNEMRNRFKSLYSVDFMDCKNYDLIIDTDNINPEEVANIIIEKFKEN